jgi:hypothetical protein
MKNNQLTIVDNEKIEKKTFQPGLAEQFRYRDYDTGIERGNSGCRRGLRQQEGCA